ncbi:hypothetical protein [Streptomyces sp. NPDC058401]|uniref:hypothetical protein n=1 Tax=Streptomyces sp. NPDC058401 TaxID=3346480 RepID=UPI003647258B
MGLTTSGPGQRDTNRAALELTVDGRPLFRSVQATWNLLATGVALGTDQLAHLSGMAETPQAYWSHRSRLPWN